MYSQRRKNTSICFATTQNVSKIQEECSTIKWSEFSQKHNSKSDFKYLGYRISEYKSDLEDKLQIYNKINEAIRRHFGKQMNKES